MIDTCVKMSSNLDLKGRNCPICSKVFDLGAVTVAEDVFDLFKFLVETIDTSVLQESLICASCLEKINKAVDFKILLLEKQKNTDLETSASGQEMNWDETLFVTCFICKKTTKRNSSVSLFNSYYENVITSMIPKDDSENLDNFKICEGCHSSAINFQRMTQFLSVYDLNKTNDNHSNGEAVTDEIEFKIDIVDNCLLEDSTLNQSLIKELKKEIKIEKSEDDFQKNTSYETKQSSTGFSYLNNEDQKRSSVLPYAENFTANTDTYDSNLTRNIANIHVDYTEYTNHLKSENDDENYNCDEIEIFKCSICGFQAQNTNDLYQHAVIHKNLNEVNSLQCQNFKFQAKDNHYVFIDKDINEVKMFKCHNCQYQTNYKSHLKTHMLIHKRMNEVEMFKCLSCEYQTKRKQDLTAHVPIHKNINEVKMFECQQCLYQTRYKKDLRKHIVIHKNINELKMFKCQNCQYQTKRKNNLKEHFMRIHTKNYKVEIFKCQNCKFQTNYRSSIRRHALIHKNVNELKMLQCQNCQYQTKHKDSLKKHMLVHTSINALKMFKCQNCHYQAKRKKNLDRHALIHKNNGIKMFKCHICNYQTQRKGILENHIVIHNK